MGTPLNVQSVYRQVLRDQQVAAARLRRELWPNMGLIIPNTPIRPTNASSWEAGAKLEFLTE